MKYFLIDGDLKITYDELLSDINEKHRTSGVYGNILTILIDLCGENEFDSIYAVLEYLNNNADRLLINIKTSGTTGPPKKINQKFSNIIRYVKNTNLNYVWGLAYDPTHFAGLQVLFQSIMNQNTLVFVFDKDFRDIPSILDSNGVTHISCTPTFMNMLLPYMYELKTLQSVSFGGERLSYKILNKTKDILPNVKIRNIYASSEAGSILASNDVGFYIPTRYVNCVKVENNQLCIHRTLLGDFEFEGDWYETGDFVKHIDETHFEFDTRSSEIVNTGGYRVSLAKIERVIENIDGVDNVVVYGRPNSIVGTLIVAEIVSNIDPQHIKNLIKTTLDLTDYERPKLVKFVDSINLTSTGKIKRA